MHSFSVFSLHGRDGADEQQRLSAELRAGGEEETPAGAAGPGRRPDR